jgi:predicted CopG family antitoxin
MPQLSTNIRVTGETYHHLDNLKRDDESFDDVIRRHVGFDE